MKTTSTFRPANPSAPQPDALQAMMGRVLTDLGAAANGALVILGDRLGIYRSLAEAGPSSSSALAERTGLDERYLREWLAAQAASGYVDYDAARGTFAMTPEQAAVFADPDSPVAMAGGFYSVSSLYHDEPRVTEVFRSGAGIPWSDHHSCLFCGTERFFRPGYVANLVPHWIPALEGVEEKLRAGAKVADVGCGHGASTLVMAKAFPDSQFTGFDLHDASIDAARQHAAEEEVKNVRFEVAAAKTFPGKDYDLVTIFDALHDMGDPAGMAAHVLECLKPDGTWMIVEPMAGDSLSENLNPVGRAFYAFSTMICTPGSKSQEVGLALGAQAGERRLAEVVKQGGFRRFRRAAETPVNLILEARP
jgi:2-polyprenyl-3-methyl-5-hydroxy-6-metoxy-1,4-benzoquinol methylase